MNFQSDMIDTLLLKDFTKGWSLGPYATASTTYYSNPDWTGKKRNASTDLRLGLAFRHIGAVTIDGRAGYQFIDFNNTNGLTTDNSAARPTYTVSAMFNTGERFSHTLLHSYEQSTAYRGVSVNYASQFTTTYQLAYAMSSDLTMRGDVSWLNIHESDGGESSDLLRFGIGPTYTFTKKTSASLRYEYTKKLSDKAVNEYDRTVISLTLNHKF